MSRVVATDNAGVNISVGELVSLSHAAEGLSFKARHARAQLTGDYLSPFKGRGMEFDESRPYQPGDDVRNLDWRVMARTGRAHTKLFREERERPVFFWVDLRAPMFFATRGAFKSVVAARVASLLAWSAQRQGDRVGGVLFSGDAHEEIKPTQGKAGVFRLINRLVANPAWKERKAVDESLTARQSIIRLRRIARPGSLVYLISDFRNLDAIATANLVRIARHNEVVMVFVHDELERQLPPPGTYRFSDGEQDLLLDTSDTRYRSRYQIHFGEHVARLKDLARQHGMTFLRCRTHDEPLAVLRQGLMGRR